MTIAYDGKHKRLQQQLTFKQRQVDKKTKVINIRINK